MKGHTAVSKHKSRTSLNFAFNLNTLYLASILFTGLKFTCIDVYSQKCFCGNQPYEGLTQG